MKSIKKIIKENQFACIVIIMLLLAIVNFLPYAYYQILRWVVSVFAFYNAYVLYKSQKSKKWMIAMIGLGILFNPIAPIYLEKETWVILDLVSAVVVSLFIKFKKYE